MKKKERAQEIFQILDQQFQDAHCELHHQSPFQLLIATILSAQCTDVQVNKVTPLLFKKYPSAKDLAKAKNNDVEKIINSTGFYKNKAKNIILCADQINQHFKGELPKSIGELTKLAGVGRKTANVLLGNAFNINEGIVVDTHVKRISNLLKLTKHSDPIKIEKDLVKLFERDQWTKISHLMIFLGRKICIARRPKCNECSLNKICPSAKL